MCLKRCPSGYQSSVNTCIYSGSVSILDMVLDTITPAIKTSTGQTLLNGATLAYYPSFEPSDPRPVQHRGLYFSGNAYIQLPPAPNTSGSPLLFTDTLSFSAWIRTQDIGKQVIFHKTSPCDSISSLLISLSASNSLMVALNHILLNVPQYPSLTITPVVPMNQWTFVAFTMDYQAGSGQTMVKIYYDGGQVYGNAENFRLTDIYETAEQYVGVGPLKADFFKGFIWRMSFYPYIHTFGSELKGNGCPAELNYCLSSAPLYQTISMENCAPHCSDGCVRTSDCCPCIDSLCDVCSDFTLASCSQCIPNASILVTCTCNQGFYFNSATRSCDLCDLSCLTCSSMTICTSCRPNAQLKGNNCECSNGYFGTANDCKACSWGCQLCSGETCERCLPGYYNVNGVCSLHCPASFSEDPKNWICLPLPNPYKGVMVNGEVDEVNCVTLNFSQPVQPQLTLEALSLLLTDIDAHTYSFSANMSMWHSQPNQTYNISVTIQETYLPADNEFSIVFLHPEVFTDVFGNHLINPFLFLTLHSLGIKSETNSDSGVPATGASTVSASSLVSGLVISLISGDSGSLFVIINNVQLLTYLPLSTIPLPDTLREQLIGLNLLTLISSPISIQNIATDIDKSLPEFAVDYGFSDSSFLSNAGPVLATVVVDLGVFVVLWLLSKVCRNSEKVRKGLEGYHWRNVGMHWILSYLDLSIAAYLQVLRVITIQLSFATAKAGLISLFGCLVAALSSIFPFGIAYLCIRDHSHAQAQQFDAIRSWKFLYEGLKNNNGWVSSAYYPLFLVRRLIHALALIYLSPFPIAQSFIFLSLALLV